MRLNLKKQKEFIMKLLRRCLMKIWDRVRTIMKKKSLGEQLALENGMPVKEFRTKLVELLSIISGDLVLCLH
jgi:hypothetical protein